MTALFARDPAAMMAAGIKAHGAKAFALSPPCRVTILAWPMGPVAPIEARFGT